MLLGAPTIFHMWNKHDCDKKTPRYYPVNGRESNSGSLLVSAYYPILNAKHTIIAMNAGWPT